MRIAVLGWSPLAVGPVLAADLALAGHQVHLAVWPDQVAKAQALGARPELRGDAAQTISGRTGMAPLSAVDDDLEAAVAHADLVFLDVHPPELELRVRDLLPALRQGQVLYVNSHGYWPALRLRSLLSGCPHGAPTVVESAAPLVAGEPEGSVIRPRFVRRKLAVAALPGTATGSALALLRQLLPDLEAAESVLHLGLESMNLMIHPGLALANLGAFDRAEAAGRGFGFYVEGNTAQASAITHALDDERQAICTAIGVPARGLLARMATLYGAQGATFQQALEACAFLRGYGEMPAGIWKRWLAVDVPFAIVPVVRVAEAVGAAAPMHRAIAEIFGHLLGFDPWARGLTLQQLGLAGKSAAEMRRFVEAGDA